MKTLKTFWVKGLVTFVFMVSLVSPVFAAESDTLSILRSGLLGAGTGAIAAEASGGKAGLGALIGAGTNVIGGALLNFFTSSSQSSSQAVYSQPVSYAQPVTYSQPVYYSQPQYSQPQTVYVDQPVYTPAPQPAPVYTYASSQPQDDPSKRIIKQGLLGAGVGAISAGASGGKAGKGALIGAGTSVIGGALFDMLTGPSTQTQSAYYSPSYSTVTSSTTTQTPKKKIVRHFDANGKIVSEEEYWI